MPHFSAQRMRRPQRSCTLSAAQKTFGAELYAFRHAKLVHSHALTCARQGTSIPHAPEREGLLGPRRGRGSCRCLRTTKVRTARLRSSSTSRNGPSIARRPHRPRFHHHTTTPPPHLKSLLLWPTNKQTGLLCALCSLLASACKCWCFTVRRCSCWRGAMLVTLSSLFVCAHFDRVTPTPGLYLLSLSSSRSDRTLARAERKSRWIQRVQEGR